MEYCNLGNIISEFAEKDPRIPFSITAELTDRCNFGCNHCYCRLPALHSLKDNELSTQEWIKILGECAQEGGLSLLFSGGEPLLREDFKEIWKAAKLEGFLVDLYTNGSLIDTELADFFAEWSPHSISITLYGATEETYKAVTGCQGMLEKVLHNIELLKSRNINVSTRSILTKKNIHEFHQLWELNEKYSKKFHWDAELFGSLTEGYGHPTVERLSADEIIRLECLHSARREEWQESIEKFGTKVIQSESPFRCSVGKGGFHITPYGMMKPCCMVEFVTYDLRNGSVSEGWRKFIPEKLALCTWSNNTCKECDDAFYCRICPAKATMEEGLPDAPVDFFCNLGRKRKMTFENKDTCAA